MAKVLASTGSIAGKVSRIFETIQFQVAGTFQQGCHLTTGSASKETGREGVEEWNHLVGDQPLLRSVIAALSSSAENKVLIWPLIRRFSELEATIKHSEDQKVWMKKELDLQDKIWNATYRETLRRLGQARLRMMEATNQLHSRGVIDIFETQFKPKIINHLVRKGTLKFDSTYSDPTITRAELWLEMKKYLLDFDGKDLTTLEMNGTKLVPPDEFAILETRIDDIYKKTSYTIHGISKLSGVVLIHSHLLPCEVNIMKGLCELLVVPWRVYRFERSAEHNAPSASEILVDDELAD